MATSTQVDKQPSIPTFYLLLTITLVLFGLRSLFNHVPALRLAIYILPIVSIILYVIRLSIGLPPNPNNKIYRIYLFPSLALYAFLLGLSFFILAYQGELSPRFFEESVFIISPLISIIFVFAFTPYIIGDYKAIPRFLFVGIFLIYMIEIDFNLLRVVEPLLGSNILNSSQSALGESRMAFVFGLLLIYLVFKKEYTLIPLGIIVVLASFKRVVIFSAAFTIGVYLFFEFVPVYTLIRRIVPLMGIIVNFLIVLNIVAFATGKYDNLIRSETGLSADEFTLGRRNLQGEVIRYFGVDLEDFSFLTSFAGLGNVTNHLEVSNAGLTNLHADVLKMFIELGPILFMFWIFFFYLFNSATKENVCLALYLNALWITDNVVIYFEVWFIFYLFVVLLRSECANCD